MLLLLESAHLVLLVPCLKIRIWMSHGRTDIQTETQTDTQTDAQTERQIDRETSRDRQTDR